MWRRLKKFACGVNMEVKTDAVELSIKDQLQGHPLLENLAKSSSDKTTTDMPECKPPKRNVMDLIALNDLNRQVYVVLHQVEDTSKSPGDYSTIPRVWYEVSLSLELKSKLTSHRILEVRNRSHVEWTYRHVLGSRRTHSYIVFENRAFKNIPNIKELAEEIQEDFKFFFTESGGCSEIINRGEYLTRDHKFTEVSRYALDVSGNGIPLKELSKYYDLLPTILDGKQTFHYGKAYVVDDLNSPDVGCLKIPYTLWDAECVHDRKKSKELVWTLSPKEDYNWIIKKIKENNQ